MLGALREKTRNWRAARTKRQAEKMSEKRVSQENWGQQKAPPGSGREGPLGGGGGFTGGR